jgi:hypothetical protein
MAGHQRITETEIAVRRRELFGDPFILHPSAPPLAPPLGEQPSAPLSNAVDQEPD